MSSYQMLYQEEKKRNDQIEVWMKEIAENHIGHIAMRFINSKNMAEEFAEFLLKDQHCVLTAVREHD